MGIGFSKCRFSSTKRALASLVADRAVERMVDEEELENAVLGLFHLVRGGGHFRAGLDLDVAAGL
jgi:hypothetical protein